MSSTASPRSILVRAPNWIGDQVLAFPFFFYLRKAFPKARIATVCVDWVQSLQFRDLVDEVFVLERPYSKSLLEKLNRLNEASKELKNTGPWDLAISLPNSISSAFLLYRTGASNRRGYKVEGRGFLLNQGVKWDANPERHRAQAYVDLIQQELEKWPLAKNVKEFWGIPPGNELDEPIPGELKEFNPEKAWPRAEPIEPPNEKYWVVAPGATANSRRWPIAYVMALARFVANEKGWKGVIVGGAGDHQLATKLCDDTTLNLHDMTATGPVSSLWKIFRNASFTLTNESGLAHVAALCGSAVQIVCGAADPRRTTPLGPGKVQVAINPIDCWPCERNVCENPAQDDIKCLRGIQPDVVWEDIKRGFINAEKPA